MFYTDFWQLRFPPFSNDARPETFVPTRASAMAHARLRSSLAVGMGASGLFGEAGVGKSRVARVVVAEFAAARWLTAYLPGPLGGAGDILRILNPDAAGQAGDGESDLYRLERFLAERAACRQPVLLAVDDVQTVRGTDFLETLRMLLNVMHGGVKALSVLLIGQASMERRLAAASGFDSQLAMRAVLEPMSPEETRLYILARLKAAGSTHGIFTRQAADLVVKYSRGLPRQVNRLCELSLVIAYGLEDNRVSPDIVEMAAADLDLLPAGEASFFPWPHPEPEPEPEEDENAEESEEDIIAMVDSGKV